MVGLARGPIYAPRRNDHLRLPNVYADAPVDVVRRHPFTDSLPLSRNRHRSVTACNLCWKECRVRSAMSMSHPARRRRIQNV